MKKKEELFQPAFVKQSYFMHQIGLSAHEGDRPENWKKLAQHVW
jgi:hypothetical protein